MKLNEFRCAYCGNIYEKGTPEEEAQEEMRTFFPKETVETCDIVCEDCYKEVDPRTHPEEYLVYLFNNGN